MSWILIRVTNEDLDFFSLYIYILTVLKKISSEKYVLCEKVEKDDSYLNMTTYAHSNSLITLSYRINQGAKIS